MVFNNPDIVQEIVAEKKKERGWNWFDRMKDRFIAVNKEHSYEELYSFRKNRLDKQKKEMMEDLDGDD